MANEQYEIYQQGTAAALAGVQLALLNSKASPDASYPSLSAGSATGITGDVETSSWMARQTNADGAALIESVKGNTLRWNQLYNSRTVSPVTANGITFTVNTDGSITANGTATETASISQFNIPVMADHKYLFKGCPSGGSGSTYYSYLTGAGFTYGGYNDIGAGNINVPTTTGTASYVLARVNSGTTVNNLVFKPQLFDLTAMFGAGNEPATVAEFEGMFPLPYYPYDAGSLLPVRMTGVETTGFNQLNPAKIAALSGVTESAGVFSGLTSAFRTAMVGGWEGIDYFPGMQYEMSFKVDATDANVNARPMAIYTDGTSSDGTIESSTGVARCVTVAGKTVDHFSMDYSNTGNVSISQPCVHLVWSGYRNGEYEAYWSEQRAIAASTYFPDGMRSAGSVRDELTATEAITRVGVVDLGTLTWTYGPTDTADKYRMVASDLAADILRPSGISVQAAISIVGYTNNGNDKTYTCVDKSIGVLSSGALVIYDEQYNQQSSPAAFKTAMSGVILFYGLATPITTPVTQPMSYRTGAGGIERVMVAEGTMSAPPIFATRYPLDPADLAASIAPVDGPTAKTNHQVGDLLMLGFTLCKATQVIVTGETIAIGTNVTRTTVAAELAALSQ